METVIETMQYEAAWSPARNTLEIGTAKWENGHDVFICGYDVDGRKLRLYLSPDEARQLAAALLQAAGEDTK